MSKIRGLIRKVDDVGRVCLPIGMKRALELVHGEQIEEIPDGNKIIIRKPKSIDGKIQLEGDTRTFDNLGRIVISSEFRKTYDIQKGTPLLIYPENDTIVLEIAEERCVFCNSKENLLEWKDNHACRGCVMEIATKIA